MSNPQPTSAYWKLALRFETDLNMPGSVWVQNRLEAPTDAVLAAKGVDSHPRGVVETRSVDAAIRCTFELENGGRLHIGLVNPVVGDIVAEPARLLEKKSCQHLDPDPDPTNPHARETQKTWWWRISWQSQPDC